jgi:hypothetical protein
VCTRRVLSVFTPVDRYGQVARTPDAKFNFPVGRKFAESVGYAAELLDSLPASMWESFSGAGNPQMRQLANKAGIDVFAVT